MLCRRSRESGSIEQDADIVLFQRDDYCQNEDEEADTSSGNTCVCAKHRSGLTGTVNLAWIAGTVRKPRVQYRLYK